MSYNPVFSKTINTLNKNVQRFSKISKIKTNLEYDKTSSDNDHLSLSQSYMRFFQSIRPSNKHILNSCQNENFVNDYISKNTCKATGYTGYTGCDSDYYQCSEKTILSEKQFCVYRSILKTEDTLKGIIILVLNFISRKTFFENFRYILSYEEQEDLLNSKIETSDYISLHEQIRDQIDNYIELDDLLTDFVESFVFVDTLQPGYYSQGFFETVSSTGGPRATVKTSNVQSMSTIFKHSSTKAVDIFSSPPPVSTISVGSKSPIPDLPTSGSKSPIPDLPKNTPLQPRKKILTPLAPRPKVAESIEILSKQLVDRAITDSIQNLKPSATEDQFIDHVKKNVDEQLDRLPEKQIEILTNSKKSTSTFTSNIDNVDDIKLADDIKLDDIKFDIDNVDDIKLDDIKLDNATIDDINFDIFKKKSKIKLMEKRRQILKKKFSNFFQTNKKTFGSIVKRIAVRTGLLRTTAIKIGSRSLKIVLKGAGMMIRVFSKFLGLLDAPLLILELIDLFNPTDYEFLRKEDLIETKKGIDEVLSNSYYETPEIKNEYPNSPFPIIRGPFDDISILNYKKELEEEIIKYLIKMENIYFFNKDIDIVFTNYNDYLNYQGVINPYFSKNMIDKIISDFLSKKVVLSDFNSNDLILQYINLIKFDDNIIFQAYNGLCKNFGGIPGTIKTKNQNKDIAFCSYTKNKCDSLYDWDLVKKAKIPKWYKSNMFDPNDEVRNWNTTEARKKREEREEIRQKEKQKYSEFKRISSSGSEYTNACVFYTPEIRELCEERGLSYNSITGICDGITKEYCIGKGVGWTGDDCTPPLETEDWLPVKTINREYAKKYLTDLNNDLNNWYKLFVETKYKEQKDGEKCKINDPSQYYAMRGGICIPTGQCKPDFLEIQRKCVSKDYGKKCDYHGMFIGQIDYDGNCKSMNICRKDFILYNGQCISQNLGNDCKISSTSFIDNKTMITDDGVVSDDGTCNKFLFKKQPPSGYFTTYDNIKCYTGFSGYTGCLYSPSSKPLFGDTGSGGFGNFGGGDCTIS